MTATIRVTPVATSGVAPFEITGKIDIAVFDDGQIIYYANGASYPAEIVTRVKGIFTVVDKTA